MLKRKDQLKSKEDVQIAEAFELYMLKNFLGIKLNSLSEKILSYWEKDLKSSFEKHLLYLNQNIENQEKYNSKFSEILQEMEIFDSENDEENQENDENENLNNENNNQDSDIHKESEEEKIKEILKIKDQNENKSNKSSSVEDSILKRIRK